MLDTTDLLLLLLGAGALAAPVAHLVIAYVYAPRKIAQWLESPRGLQAALGQALPVLGKSLDDWSKTPEGEAFMSDLVDAIIEKGKMEATKMLGRQSGHSSQKALPALYNILGGVKTGNPTMDGMWAMVAPLVLPKIGPFLLKAMPQLMEQAAQVQETLPEG